MFVFETDLDGVVCTCVWVLSSGGVDPPLLWQWVILSMPQEEMPTHRKVWGGRGETYLESPGLNSQRSTFLGEPDKT